jgi:hypothetical protein
MRSGLLWFDDDPAATLEEKVRALGTTPAAAHYEHKHGLRPDLCFVHPLASGGNGKVEKADGVTIRPGRSVLPHHFWLDKDDTERRRASGDGKPQPRHSLQAGTARAGHAQEARADVEPIKIEQARQLAMALELEPQGQEVNDGR